MPFALLGLAVVASGCSSGEAALTNGAPELAVIERRSLEVQAEAAGQIEPIRVVEVKSKASGEILSLSFETGDVVQRGALLATIDPRDVQNALDQARADLEVAKARDATSKAQRKRTEDLRAANVVTAQELESSLLDEANSAAQLIKASTNLQLAEERMKDVRITAPLDGTVIQKTVEIGQIIASASGNVSGGTTLLKMADLSQMQVRSLIDETDLGRIRAGMPVQVTVEAYPDRRFRGQVLKIEPQAVVDQNVTMFPVLVMLDNNEGLLKPGMNADVVIEIATRENVVVVPNAAVVGTQDAVAAGAVLGLNEEQVTTAMNARPNGNRAQAQPAGPAAAGDSAAGRGQQAAAPGQQAAAPGAQAVAGSAEDCMALFRRIRESGGAQNLSAADRTKMEACRAQMGGGRGLAGGRGGQGASGASRDPDQRPGVVFIAADDGTFVARRVTLGLNDFDYTEVVRGLDEGEKVVMISVARLQQQQQEFLNRMRERSTGQGPIATPSGPGMGGPGGGGGRR
jgi:HlyD family secretion protein